MKRTLTEKRWYLVWMLCLLFTAAAITPALARPTSLSTPSDLALTEATYLLVTVEWTIGDTADVAGYEIYRGTDADLTWTPLGTTETDVFSFTDLTVTPGSDYYYIVRAFANLEGGGRLYSDYSNQITVHVPDTPATPPTPINLQAVLNGSNINLTWDGPPSAGIYYYAVKVKINDGAFGPLGGTLDNYLTHSGVVEGTTYTYRVNMVVSGNADICSDFSNEASVTVPSIGTPPAITIPNAPSDLEVVGSGTSATITWQDNAGNEDAFIIDRRTGSGDWVVYQEMPADDETFTDTGLTRGNTYTYRIQAYNSAGSSSESNLDSYTVPAAAVVTPPPTTTTTPAASKQELNFYISSLEFYVNGTIHSMDTPPVILGGRTLMPIRYVAENLGADVAWDPVTSKVTVSLGSKTIQLWIGRSTATVNGVEVAIDPENPGVAPFINASGRTMLPLRFIAENLGCQVDWNPANSEVKITYPK